ncbi:MAG: polysaccharide biosynthesis/export family protein [Akkermansiaceae bacterium]|jgi:protein involved in polysaccharide export with SLBB domain|nr:polysaccharide biosynthesis/export family protein [Akkermansiaceae bacterium]MDP4647934.1 polysaccharide biosynthesis/export family protein [Akkermansiaceae bacterium]MDP4719724.1 polysaccharide biosynthesis/export family protein [Akkermansiaceae bacterium]MDP4781279.1 polysaccharide biosynthesis/export family protein [Akkermansiaceae bacterium]MDP4846035.1 polysaccharide biosynthesis/export family protein [Akkermansiaceae bacterium]
MKLKNLLAALIGLSFAISPAMSQIESGTSVQITIMGVPTSEKGSIDGLYPVSEGGNINMPYIGSVRAAGMNPENLAASIQSRYKAAEIYTTPTIQVIDTRGGAGVKEQMIHVGGQVRRTGPVNWQKNLTIYQAVQSAGGATEFGSLKRVKLYRNGRMQTYDLTNPQFMRVPMEPNDTIEVPQKNWFGQ